jgi:hypothetical protein
MSECVVRMEMPQRCDSCDFWHVCKNVADFGAARYFEGPRELTVGMKGCKIVCQLPEGHGRLVDADELSKYWKCRIALMNSCSGKRGILESVEASTLKSCIEDMGSAKTIVPAERRET